MVACLTAKTKSGTNQIVGYHNFPQKPNVGQSVQINGVWWKIKEIQEPIHGYLNITVM